MSKISQNDGFWKLAKKIIGLLQKEITTTIGRVNVVSDIVLAAIVAIVFTANVFENVAIAVVSIWNKEVSEYLSSADVLTAFIILVVFFVVCLGFIGASEKLNHTVNNTTPSD